MKKLRFILYAVFILCILCCFVLIAAFPLKENAKYQQACETMNEVATKFNSTQYMILIDIDNKIVGVYYNDYLLNQFNQKNLYSDVNSRLITYDHLLNHGIVLDEDVLEYLQLIEIDDYTPVWIYNNSIILYN